MSGGEPTCSIVPARITATRSPNVRASSWSWVTRIVVTPMPVSSRRTSLRSCQRNPASRLENGSSRRIDPRFRGESPGEGDTLLLATGQRPGHPRRLVGEPDEVERGGAALLPALAAWDAVADVAGDGLVREQGALLEDHPDAALLRRHAASRRDVTVTDDDAPGGRRLQPGDAAQQRRLAAPGRAEQGEDLAGLDLSDTSCSTAAEP